MSMKITKRESKLLKEVAQQRRTIHELTKMVRLLTEKVDYLTRQRFAPQIGAL